MKARAWSTSRMLLVLTPAVLVLCGFTLTGPETSREILPSDSPPFVHWDLREFRSPPCTVPYSFADDTNDILDPDRPEEAEVNAAFAAWEAVDPAIIKFGFVNTSRQEVSCPGDSFDSFNLIGWNG